MKKISALLIVLCMMLSLTFGSLVVFADDPAPSATPAPAEEQQTEYTEGEDGTQGTSDPAGESTDGHSEADPGDDGQPADPADPDPAEDPEAVPTDVPENDTDQVEEGTPGTETQDPADDGTDETDPGTDAQDESGSEAAGDDARDDASETADSKETEQKKETGKLLEGDEESGAVTEDSESKEEKTVLYVGTYELKPGKSLNLGKHDLGTGSIKFDANGTDITFNKVNFSSKELSNGGAITLYSVNHKHKKFTLTLTGENVIENGYEDAKGNNTGNTLQFRVASAGVKPVVTIKGSGTLAISGGSNGLFSDADVNFNLEKGGSITSTVKKGNAIAVSTGEEGAEKKGYESGYTAKHITFEGKTAGTLPKKNEISLTSLSGTDKKYAYYETLYNSDKTSKPAVKAAIAYVPDPVYAFSSGSDTEWTKGSTDGLKATVTRDPYNEDAYDHFSGIQVDGSEVDSSHYSAESGSVKLTIKPEYLETLSAGDHTLAMVFDDGTANTDFTVVEEKVKMVINVRGNVVLAEYNGELQSAKGCKASSDNALFDISKMAFAEGKSAKAETKDVGTVQMGLTADYFVYNDDSVEATFNVTDGYVEVTPAPLTVTTGTASKVYDGKPLTSVEAKVSGLAEGEKVTITTTGSQTAVGSSQNTFTITWDTAKESNYTLTQNLGTLTVRASGSGGGNGGSGGGNNSNGGSNGSKSASNAKTGDTTNMTPWIVLIIAVGAAAVAAVFFMKRRRG